jgi:hypothetical protein
MSRVSISVASVNHVFHHLSPRKLDVRLEMIVGSGEGLYPTWALTADRSVQFTDWDTGDRVIVNFGDRPFERKGKEPVFGCSFVIERTEPK